MQARRHDACHRSWLPHFPPSPRRHVGLRRRDTRCGPRRGTQNPPAPHPLRQPLRRQPIIRPAEQAPRKPLILSIKSNHIIIHPPPTANILAAASPATNATCTSCPTFHLVFCAPLHPSHINLAGKGKNETTSNPPCKTPRRLPWCAHHQTPAMRPRTPGADRGGGQHHGARWPASVCDGSPSPAAPSYVRLQRKSTSPTDPKRVVLLELV